MRYEGEAELDRVLCFLEDRIDLEQCERTRCRHVRALSWETVDRPPVTIAAPPQPEWQPLPYGEVYGNPAKMLFNELVGPTSHVTICALNSVLCGDDFPLQVRANHGCGLFPSLFGAESIVPEDDMPWSRPIGGPQAAWPFLDRGVPAPTGELMDRVIEAMGYYREKLAAYPKCGQAIRITQPNLLGPFEAAMSLFGSDMLLAAQDEPKNTAALLDLLADAYVAAVRKLTPYTTEDAGRGHVYLHWQICRGACLLRDDSAILMSPRLYEEFVRPTNERVFRQLGDGAIHWCGRADHLRESVFTTLNLACLDFGEPHLNDMNAWYTHARQRRAAIMRMQADREFFASHEYQGLYPTGMSFVAKVAGVEEGRRLMDTVAG